MSGPDGEAAQSAGERRNGEPLVLGEAEQVIEALNEAIAIEEGPQAKARFLLERLQQMLVPSMGPQSDVELYLQAEVLRQPAPRILERIQLGPTFQNIEPRSVSDLQTAMDEAGPALRQIVPDVLQNLRNPRTVLLSEDITDRGWFEQVRETRLRLFGWEDVLAANWAASEDRLVALTVLVRRDQPRPGEEARRLVALMLRAIAPIVDREMFENLEQRAVTKTAPLEGKDLSGRQTDVLHLLLRGMSEKEVARELGVSTHTVHTHVKKLYAEFGVNSRGELLAQFVDKRVLKMTG